MNHLYRIVDASLRYIGNPRGAFSWLGVCSTGGDMSIASSLPPACKPINVYPVVSGASRWVRVAMAAIALLMSACAVTWVSPFDKDAVERTTEISKAILKFYQDVLAIEPNRRRAAIAGALGSKQGDIESLMRLHVLKEQARAKNDQSSKVAENLLESWQKFSQNHRSDDSTALSDATLSVERGILERHLRAAFVAEEAKKLGSGSK